jgi:hypothetical protein
MVDEWKLAHGRRLFNVIPLHLVCTVSINCILGVTALARTAPFLKRQPLSPPTFTAPPTEHWCCRRASAGTVPAAKYAMVVVDTGVMYEYVFNTQMLFFQNK